MFKRPFMETLKINKYARQAGNSGRISSNLTVKLTNEIIIQRILVYFLTTCVVTTATADFSFFYEIFTHLPQPVNKPRWENSVPDYVKIPNEEVIEGWNKIHQMRALQKTFDF